MAQIISIDKIRADDTIRRVLKFMHEEFDRHTTGQTNIPNRNIEEAFALISDAARTSQKYTRTQIDAGLACLADQFKIAQ